ncbi:neprilysin-11-like [Acanthaster planci]|uniref:Neprilysin-11-like n=1 Tax=Acanthaster planci TaxID=133434 RepID=A0A8B7YC53_ACAPL|nr:neprilysin-11-like [Acanthaster planci]
MNDNELKHVKLHFEVGCSFPLHQSQLARTMEGKRSVSKSQLALEEGVTSKTPSKIPFLLAGIFVATTVALLITTIVFALQKNHIANMLEQLMKGTSKPHEPGPRPICTTKQCYDSAYLYLSNMDQTKAPCDNFFDYACGGWTKRYTVPEDQTRFSTLTKLREGVADRLRVLFERSPTLGEPDSYHIVRNDYKSCEDMDTINNLGVKPLTDLLTSLGGWPVVGDNPAGGNWNPAAFDFEKLWADIRGKYGVQMFVATGTWPDPDNAAKYKLDAYVPDFVVPKFDIEKRHWPGVHPMLDGTDDAGYDATMLFDDKYSSERKAYLQYLIDIAVALGANETVATRDMIDLIEFESTMANLTVKHPDFDRVMTTLEEIGMNLIDWVRLYQLMLPGSVDPGVTGDEPIVNYNPNYISNVTVWLRDQDNRVKANYMIWRLVSRMVPFMGETFLVIRRKFLQSVNGTVATTARWKTCASNVNNQYKFISGRMYVDEHFPEDTKRKV